MRTIDPKLWVLLAALVATGVALVLTPVVRAVALKHGFMDQPGARKIHTRPIAYGGGIVIALALGLSVGAALWLNPALLYEQPALAKELRPLTFAVLAACTLGALLLGLLDDKYKLSPWTKLSGQIVLATAVMLSGLRITALVGDTLLMKAVTVAWIVLITNSFNLLDNMDGLCAGVAGIVCALLGLLAAQGGQWLVDLSLLAVCGACLGFLRYNRAPASVFLGDAGSLLLGFLVACLTAMVTYYRYRSTPLAVGIPVLVLAIPLYDTGSVILIRFREHRPLMRGDTSHFSHRLVELGMSPRQAVDTIYLACLAIGLPATVLGQLSNRAALLIVTQACMVLTLVALLERTGRARERQNRRRRGEEEKGRRAEEEKGRTGEGESGRTGAKT